MSKIRIRREVRLLIFSKMILWATNILPKDCWKLKILLCKMVSEELKKIT